MPIAEFADFERYAKNRKPIPTPRSAARPTATAPGARPAEPAQAPLRPQTYAMFVRHMEDTTHLETRKRIGELVSTVYQVEIESLIKRSADLKGRYFAALLELNKTRGAPNAGDIEQVRQMRLMIEEIDQGLALMKDAIGKGLLGVEGLTDDPYP